MENVLDNQNEKFEYNQIFNLYLKNFYLNMEESFLINKDFQVS